MFHVHLKEMRILLLLGGELYECQLAKKNMEKPCVSLGSKEKFGGCSEAIGIFLSHSEG